MARKKKTEDQEETLVIDTPPVTKEAPPVAPKPKRKAIEIRAATLRNFFFCNYTYDHTVAPDTTNSVTCKSQVAVHPDLKKAFKKLHAHLAAICEEIDTSAIKDINDIADYNDEEHEEGSIEHRVSHFAVSSFSLEGYDDKEGVILVGEKRLSTGDYVGLKTPKRLWSDSYPFIYELQMAIGDLLVEVEAYMNGSKQAEDPQQKLDFGDDEQHYAEEDL